MSEHQPTAGQAPEQPISQPTPAPKPLPPKNIPDWKPLGAIRDYFTEQMKQDGFYGR